MRAVRATLLGLSLLCDTSSVYVARTRPGSRTARSRTAGADDDTEDMGGVPVHDFRKALDFERKTSTSSVGKDPEDINASWIVWFKDNMTEDRLDELCTEVFTGCSGHGDRTNQTGHMGLAFLACRCTPAELRAALTGVAEETLLGAFDAPVHVGDSHLDFSGYLAENAEGAATWGLNRIGRDSAPATGIAVHAYVLDTGVRCTHSQFGGRAIPTIESLGGGYVHKCECSNTSCANDTHGHGTHCAGTVGGVDYGVAPQARIHSVKVLDDQGNGYTSWTIMAESWILANGMRPGVLSLSLGGWGNNQAEKNSIETLVADGLAVVVAAGNEEDDACQYNPAWIPAAITVGSTTPTDEMSWFSNFGTCVDIFAPGSSVVSLGHRSDTLTKTMSGTSMACPHVTGAVAILFALNPAMTPAQALAELLAKAVDGVINSLAADTVNKLLQVGSLSGGVKRGLRG